MARDYVPVSFDWIEETKELNDQEKGRLIDAVVLYACGGDWEERIKGNERYLFPALMKRIDRSIKLSETRSKARYSVKESSLTNDDKPQQNATNDNKTRQTMTNDDKTQQNEQTATNDIKEKESGKESEREAEEKERSKEKEDQEKAKEKEKEKELFICPEPLETAPGQVVEASPEPALYQIVLNDKSYFAVTQAMVDEYQNLYPAVDVHQQIRNMVGWCDSNPTKRKTRRGIRAFINSWLTRAQDRGGNHGGNKPANQFVSFSQLAGGGV